MVSSVTACQLLYLRRRNAMLGVKGVTQQEAVLATLFMQQRRIEVGRGLLVGLMRTTIAVSQARIAELKIELKTSENPGEVLRRIDVLLDRFRVAVEKMEAVAGEVSNPNLM
ncbi:MAG: hypothetical protein FOGNACKC_00927 [Anaerolineae bacterium]|nr:hypothetical protein [Anaerolineae bacterium]